MAVSGPLSHIDISVGYPEKSIPFYAAFLESLGFKRWNVPQPEWQGPSPERATWSIKYANGARFGIEVRPARPESRDQKYDRYEPGPHHLAFHADSREAVERVHAAMLAVGATVLDPPAEYGGQPAYGDAYFAAFYADPDGVKLEVVFLPRENP